MSNNTDHPAGSAGSVSRRQMLKLLGMSPAALALTAAGAHAAPPAIFPFTFAPPDPFAGSWRTWLAGTSALAPAPPPSIMPPATEIAELLQLQAQRGDAALNLVRFWDHQGGVGVWTQTLLDKIKERAVNPPLASRALALLHAAMADAAVAAWAAKFRYRRFQPATVERRLRPVSEVPPLVPGYPSEHAAVAAAAAGVLNYLFPGQTAVFHGQTMTFDAAAAEAALSRLWAGSAVRSDINAGAQLGQAVAALAVQRGSTDGSDQVWDKVTQPGRLTGPNHWVPTAPGFVFPPLLPLAGTWRPWLMSSGSQFRPPVPPALQGAFPSDDFLRGAQEVKTAVDGLTPDQLNIAQFWADDPGATFTPPGHWASIAAAQVGAATWSTPRAARALALVSASLADAAISCWDAKYTYWVLRPITAIRTFAGQPFYDPNFLTPVVTPAFPSYTSGHATFSGAAAATLGYLFPKGKTTDAFGHSVSYREAAEQAALSRLLGGIHYRSDNEEGLICGRHIADLAVARVRGDQGS